MFNVIKKKKKKTKIKVFELYTINDDNAEG